jgi:hypothetical protein
MLAYVPNAGGSFDKYKLDLRVVVPVEIIFENGIEKFKGLI